ncbi:hypothetical protein Tco_0014768 [Tanacetum coccineum]
MSMWIISRGVVLLILLMEYKVLRDFLLHRSSINNSARLSNKFGGFYFSFKFDISGLLHQVITTIAYRIRDKDTSQSKQNLQSSSMTFIHKTLIIPSVLDSCFISSTVSEVKRYTAYVRRIDADFSHATPNEYSPSPDDKKQWSSKLEYKFQDKENSEDIFSFGSALEDFISVVFVPDRNIEDISHGRSCFLRYIDTKGNGEYPRICSFEGPYKLTSVVIEVVAATVNSPEVPEHDEAETVHNMSEENKLQKCKSISTSCPAAQPYSDNYYQASKIQRSNVTSSSTRPSASTRHKGKEIVPKTIKHLQSESYLKRQYPRTRLRGIKEMQKEFGTPCKGKFAGIKKDKEPKLEVRETVGRSGSASRMDTLLKLQGIWPLSK